MKIMKNKIILIVLVCASASIAVATYCKTETTPWCYHGPRTTVKGTVWHTFHFSTTHYSYPWVECDEECN